MALSITQHRKRFAGLAISLVAGFVTGGVIAGSVALDGPPRTARAGEAYEEDATPESLPHFTLRWLFGVGMGRKLHFEALQLYYLDPITEQEARATGSFLRRLGIGQRETLAQLRQIRTSSDANPPIYELRIGTPFSRKEHIDRETRTVYQMMALSAEGALFDGAPVQVSLCNTLLQPLVILRPRLRGPSQAGPAGDGSADVAGDASAGAAEASGEPVRIPVR